MIIIINLLIGEERIETLKKEYAKVKKELMRIRLEERRNR